MAPHPPHDDENFADYAEKVAESIVHDFRGLPIGAQTHQIMTNQLEARIFRALVAAHCVIYCRSSRKTPAS